MEMSALLDGPDVFTVPLSHQPSRMGSPSSARTWGLALALSRASRKTSVWRMTEKTKKTSESTNAAKSARIATQPVGTNHFQLRCHQLRLGAVTSQLVMSNLLLPDGRARRHVEVLLAVDEMSMTRLGREDQDALRPRLVLLDARGQGGRQLGHGIDPGLEDDAVGVDVGGRSGVARFPGRDLPLAVAQHGRRPEEDQGPAAVGEAAADAALRVEAVGGLHPLVEGLGELVAVRRRVGVAPAPESLVEIHGLMR